MNSYIIGASGFLGSHIFKWLSKHGLVRKALSYDPSDIVRWQHSIIEDLRTYKPDVVLIAGASQEMGDDQTALHSLLVSNCELPCRVAQQLLQHSPMTKLIVFGTSWQFSDSNCYRPFNLYAASKQASRDLLEHFALRGLRILQLILFDTYGGGDTRSKLLNILQDACAYGKQVHTTAAEQEIDLVHIDDVCAGVHAGIRELDSWDPTHGVMIRGLGSGQPIQVKDLIERVESKLGKKLMTKIGAREYRTREVMKVYRAYKRPEGWVPSTTEFHSKNN